MKGVQCYELFGGIAHKKITFYCLHVPATSSYVVNAMKSFAGSSSGGIDGLLPGHIRDLTSVIAAEVRIRLLDSISTLINLFSSENLSDYPRKILFAANLTTMRKKDGAIRPIAVGNIFRRIASKIACRPAVMSLCSALSPIQLGIGIRGGCEAAANATRSLLKEPDPTQRLMVKMD